MLKIVCAWCGYIINQGEDINDKVSHGICDHCFKVLMAIDDKGE
jgi:hypothetical protein